METFFAPAQRTERRKFENQVRDLSRDAAMSILLKVATGLLVVLNEDRQIVALNHAFLDALGITNPEEALGLRLGETLGCIHAHELPNGCGTTPFCATCGAAIAMMTAINDDRESESTCALTSGRNGVYEDICLLIRAQPVAIDDHRWILVFAHDVTQEQYWNSMEKVFLHDVSNILATLTGRVELLHADLPNSCEVKQILETAWRLNDEINLQKSLSHTKGTAYSPRRVAVAMNDIRREVELLVSSHGSAKGKKIAMVWPIDEITLYSDRLLLSRILDNLLINAMEATEEGGSIGLHVRSENSHVVWEVWNRRAIDRNIQKRIFQRHFSTKAKVGRGLGTYSAKLFGEKYLGGELTFSSDEKTGTTFMLRLPVGGG